MAPPYWLVLLPLVGVYAQTMDNGPPPASETEVSTALSEQSPSPTTVNTNNGNAGTSTVLVVADGTTSTVQSDTTMTVIVATFAPGSPASPDSTTYVASGMSTTTPSIVDDGATSATPSDAVLSETSDASTTDAGTSVITTPVETPSGASDTPTTLETVPSPTTDVPAQTTTQTDPVATSPVPPAAAPPITSCNLATFPASTGASATTKESSLYCSCNDEQQADVGSITDADGYTTFTCDLGSSTTLAVTTQPPAITSCSLSTQPATVISGQSFSEKEMCDCNGFWQAGLSTTVGPDKTTSWICAVEATATDATPIVVKTQDPAPERTPYLPGICTLHILQAFEEGGDTSWLSLDIQDPDGAELASNKVSEVKWDDTYTLDEDDTGLPWPLGVTPAKAVWPEGQVEPKDVVTQQEVPLTIHTGEVQFQSDDPQACSVSGWMWDDATGDVGETFGVDEAMLNRQMQCTFAC